MASNKIVGLKEITPGQYAKMQGCTLANITNFIRQGKKLQFVIEVKSFGRFYVLVVPDGLSKKDFKSSKK